MMKKILLGLFVVSLLVVGSAMRVQAGETVYGLLYKDATEAGEGFGNSSAYKKGTATCKSFLALVALGDCSVNAAAKNGKIQNVTYYDIYTKNILGYKRVTVNAYGR